jgi:hypothetical protein
MSSLFNSSLSPSENIGDFVKPRTFCPQLHEPLVVIDRPPFRSGTLDCVASGLLANLSLAIKIARRPRSAPTLLRSSAAIEKLDLPAACNSRSRLSSSFVHLLLLFAGTGQRLPKKAGRRSHSVRPNEPSFNKKPPDGGSVPALAPPPRIGCLFHLGLKVAATGAPLRATSELSEVHPVW